MNFFQVLFEILVIASPLLLISTGALLTEHCGVLAVFVDGVVNLSSFLFFTFSFYTKNIFIGMCLSVLILSALIFLLSIITNKTKANPFIVGLSFNLFSTGLIQIISERLFHTKGVLTAPEIFTSHLQEITRPVSIGLSLILAVLVFLFLKYTRTGIAIRVTGESPKLLTEQNKNPQNYKTLSWIVSAVFSCFAGFVLTLKVSSFVPNISGGRGWLALATVLAGQKKIPGILLSILVFSCFEFMATWLQGSFSFIPPSVILATPYLVAIIAFFLIPRNLSADEQRML